MPKIASNLQKLEERGTDQILLQNLQKKPALPICLFQTSSLWNWGTINFCYFKLPSSWHFYTADLEFSTFLQTHVFNYLLDITTWGSNRYPDLRCSSLSFLLSPSPNPSKLAPLTGFFFFLSQQMVALRNTGQKQILQKLSIITDFSLSLHPSLVYAFMCIHARTQIPNISASPDNSFFKIYLLFDCFSLLPSLPLWSKPPRVL